jgi:hypothetical protein
MVTLGIGLMLFEAANQLPSITGGADGLSRVSMWKVLGGFSFDRTGTTACVYGAVVLFLLFVIARRVVASPFGLGLRGVRENAKRMLAIGAPVTKRLIAVYMLSAAMAWVAGGLLAQTTQFVGLDVFGFPRSADLMIMLVLGGAGGLYGGVLGAAHAPAQSRGARLGAAGALHVPLAHRRRAPDGGGAAARGLGGDRRGIRFRQRPRGRVARAEGLSRAVPAPGGHDAAALRRRSGGCAGKLTPGALAR